MSGFAEFESVAACDLCGATRYVDVAPAAAVVACAACGFRFVTPRPTSREIARAYSASDAYDGWHVEEDARRRMWERRWRRVAAAWSHRRGSRGRGRQAGRLLDVGAGIGTFLDVARHHGWQGAGTEVSMSAIAHARARYGIELVHGAVEDAPVQGPFDVVTLWHVLEHVPSPRTTLARCAQLLSEGGLLFVAVPNDGDAVQALATAGRGARRLLARPHFPRYEPLRPGVELHLSHYDDATLTRRLERSGFELLKLSIDDAAPQRSPLGHLAFAARRAVTRLTPLHLGRELLAVARRGTPP